MDDVDVELLDGAVERELSGGDLSFEHGQRRAAVGAGQGPGLRRGDVGPFGRLGELLKKLGRQERHVRRNDDTDLGAREAQPGRDADDCRAVLAPVVQDLKRQRQVVRRLPHDDNTTEGFFEDSVSALGKCLPAEARERLRRAEPRARAADEQDTGYVSIRHGSE